MCGYFNIHFDIASTDSVKFMNCLDSRNITQHVHTPTYLHGDTLDLVLTPMESNIVSNVRVGGFILDHFLVHSSAPKLNTVTFWRTKDKPAV